MKKKDADRFLKAVEQFAINDPDTALVERRLRQLINSVGKVGFPYTDKEFGMSPGYVSQLQKKIQTMLQRFATRDEYELSPPEHRLHVTVRPADRMPELRFIEPVYPLHEILPYATVLVMLNQEIRGVTQCGHKKCDHYIFQRRKTKKYCSPACKQANFRRKRQGGENGS